MTPMPPMPPRAPLSHRILGHHITLALYGLIGKPPITYRWRNVVTEMRGGPGDVAQVKTTKTIRAKDFE